MKSNVRKQGECAVQLRRRGVERQCAGFPAACWRKVDTEECDLIGNVEAFTTRCTFAQHGRSQVCYSCLARRVGCAAISDEKNKSRKWKLVLFDDNQLQTVRELPREDWGKRYARRRAQFRRLGSVECSLRKGGRLDGKESQHAQRAPCSNNSHRSPPAAVSIMSFFPSGTTVRTIFGRPR